MFSYIFFLFNFLIIYLPSPTLTQECTLTRDIYDVHSRTTRDVAELKHTIMSVTLNALSPEHCNEGQQDNYYESNHKMVIRTTDGDFDLPCLVHNQIRSVVSSDRCTSLLRRHQRLRRSVGSTSKEVHVSRPLESHIEQDIKRIIRRSTEYNLEKQMKVKICYNSVGKYMKSIQDISTARFPVNIISSDGYRETQKIEFTKDSYMLSHSITFKVECNLIGDEYTTLSLNVLWISSSSHSTVGDGTHALLEVNSTSGFVVHKNKTFSRSKSGLEIERVSAVAIVKSQCWKRISIVGTCEGDFILVPELLNSPLLKYSPLDKSFWSLQSQDRLLQSTSIIWLKISTLHGNIPSEWVTHLNVSNLETLILEGNDWGRPQRILPRLPELKWLLLTNNNIEVLPNETLQNIPEIEYVFLDHNNMSSFPDGVQHLTEIKEVSISRTSGSAVLPLSDVDLENLSNITILWLGETNLQADINKIMKLQNIRCLNLSGSNIKTIYDDERFGAPNLTLTECDLSYNKLQTLPANLFSRLTTLTSLRLQNNDFISCPELAFQNLVSLHFLYLSRNRISSLGSTCFSGLTNLTVLDLASNNILSLTSGMFDSLKFLEELNLSNNNISMLSSQVFLPLISLKILDLAHNFIRREPVIGTVHLDKLILSYNMITKIVNMTISCNITSLDLTANNISDAKLYGVKHANLSFNHLRTLSEAMWESLNGVKTLDLGGNKLKCCDRSILSLLKKLGESRVHVVDLNRTDTLSCSLPEEHQTVLLNKFMYSDNLCMPLEKSLWLEAGIPLGLMFAMALVIAVGMYWYRFELTYISYLFKMKKRESETDDARYGTSCYDAFVCYSGKNFRWVIDELIPRLEEGDEGYRLCLHDRDFTVGAPIDKNIVASIEKSRKVIIVLSADFINSRWCQWELEMANHKTFEDDKDYVILIEIERLDRKSMPRHVRYLMDTRTYLEWPPEGADERRQRRAWQRLRDALGPSLIQRTGKKPQPGTVLYLQSSYIDGNCIKSKI